MAKQKNTDESQVSPADQAALEARAKDLETRAKELDDFAAGLETANAELDKRAALLEAAETNVQQQLQAAAELKAQAQTLDNKAAELDRLKASLAAELDAVKVPTRPGERAMGIFLKRDMKLLDHEFKADEQLAAIIIQQPMELNTLLRLMTSGAAGPERPKRVSAI